MKHRMAYVYMVRCKDDSLYTGIAKDLGHRMNEHYYKKKKRCKIHEEPTDPDFGDGMGDRGLVAGGEN